jgi:hypothetical protein
VEQEASEAEGQNAKNRRVLDSKAAHEREQQRQLSGNDQERADTPCEDPAVSSALGRRA